MEAEHPPSDEWSRANLEQLELAELVRRVRILAEFRDAFDAVLSERDVSDTDSSDLRRERGRMASELNALVEVVGDVGARLAMRDFDAQASEVFVGRGSGTVDMVFECSDGFLAVLENKGGTSRLGSQGASGRRLRQGSVDYLRATAHTMVRSADPETASLGARILTGIDGGTVRYGIARTDYTTLPIDEARRMSAEYPNRALEQVDAEALSSRDRMTDFKEPVIEWVYP